MTGTLGHLSAVAWSAHGRLHSHLSVAATSGVLTDADRPVSIY